MEKEPVRREDQPELHAVPPGSVQGVVFPPRPCPPVPKSPSLLEKVAKILSRDLPHRRTKAKFDFNNNRTDPHPV